MQLSESILSILQNQVMESHRPDLFRTPICAFSAADDPRYPALKTIIGPWHRNPRELLPEAQSVISYFVPFTRAVPLSAQREEPVSPLWGEAYLVLNSLFDVIGGELTRFLHDLGYSTFHVASTHTYDQTRLQSMWSHRSAAAISGLGSFGRNRLLITEKGSAGRFCTLLTSAPLEPSAAIAPDRCLRDNCSLCIKACPVGALQTDSFAPFLCNHRLLENAEHLPNLDDCDVCGKCIASCPQAYLE